MYPLPVELQESYLDSANYPENLIPSGIATYKSKLVSYKERLDDAEVDLCLGSTEDEVEKVFEIPVIDLDTSDGKGRDKRNIHSPAKLTEWLGVTTAQNPNDANTQLLMARKKDPKCRFIYLYGQHSRDKLKTTRESLCQLLSYHQVMPVYLDFMLVFGGQTDAIDPRFSGFREQIRLRNPRSGHGVPELNRSGKLFQLSYNLKGVHLKKRDHENIKLNVWSIRDAAIYHKFDVEYGTTLWIVTKGGKDILERYADLTKPDGRPEDIKYDNPTACFRSTLVTHLLYCHWATEDWRWYIVWLERVIHQESGMAVNGLRREECAYEIYEPQDIQDLQHWQDEANAVVMVLESNAKIVGALRSFYKNLVSREDFPSALKTNCEDHLHAFFSQLDEIMGDFDMQLTRAKLLVKIISDRKELVLQHLHRQASDRTEQLNKNLEREAVVMRIITIVTLLYLPATFVSTFFSTDVIKYQDQDQNAGSSENSSFSSLALERWLQVTIPLTFLTLLGAWSTYRFFNSTVEHFTFFERLKHIVPGLTSSASVSLASGTAQGYSDANTRKDASKRLVSSTKRLARIIRWFRTDRATLPSYKPTAPKTG
ncbi:hypothetical protein COCCADRAFT_109750 [Bipolaris zeicola 26-R-13]|uniref:CorA-like transporter domain-containing protein n=1 Tax=Cochliobolus carbonum (strain 26-R-13) TaxID=930089 RepID=W6XRI9_COCC2|nr:uncharacterized protein COCCADRAFT_109750 [Bipolaris zeicola 26-R-13]EUC28208.1 hypothetical protein COCCADRAFT_109750 [Bipolaris zeicola 26-R-13]